MSGTSVASGARQLCGPEATIANQSFAREAQSLGRTLLVRTKEFALSGSYTSPGQTQPISYEQADPDVRLMLQVRAGSAAAFEELVLRYQARLLTVLEHLVNNREQAEDLAQEVFLRVFRARERYEPGAKFSTWLFTIANNVASNSLRSKSRRKEVGVPDRSPADSSPMQLDQLALAASGQMPARALDKAEAAEVVRVALESLNPRQRMALLLSKFEGMSYQDIADSMDMTVQATKSLLSRARENLRMILSPYVENGVRPSEFAAADADDS